MLHIYFGDRLEFNYKNWKGTYSKRCVIVKQMSFGAISYHPETQWVMTAFDLDKREDRFFAMKDMFNVQKVMKG